MCGIAGIVGDSTGEIKKITQAISHRGPDQNGFFTDKNIALGHRRLSILDLSEKGKQPMSNSEETVWVVFNGEIYNYAELKKSLGKKYQFKSASDTEVLVHGYSEWGIQGLLEKIQGDFAFALWDSNKKKLFLARDRIGVKPLYYAIVNGDLVFGSEQKAILSHTGFKREIDPVALDEYLSLRYEIAPRTLFKGLFKLLPGYYAVFDGNLKTSKYWDFSNKPENHSENYFIGQTRSAIRESVKARLMSDVPLGAFLSGGLDSSYVVALMSEFGKVNTFSVGFNQEDDETKYAKVIAETFGTNHREIFVDLKPSLLPIVTWHLDEPIADIAALPTYLMAKETKKHVTVVLTGDGGDEVFGGYPRYVWLPKLFKTPGAKLLSKAARLASLLKGKEYCERLKQALEASGEKNPAKVFLAYASAFSEKEKKSLYSPWLKSKTNASSVEKTVSGFLEKEKNFLDSMLYFDLKTLLPDDYLMKVDKTTMSFGVESRVPYLDEGVLDLASRIPAGIKVGFKTKGFMRKVVRDLLPKEIVERKKQGFNVPTSKWLKGELGEVAEQFLSAESIQKRGLFDAYPARKVLENYRMSPGIYGRQFWALFALELWCRMYLDNNALTKNQASLGIGL